MSVFLCVNVSNSIVYMVTTLTKEADNDYLLQTKKHSYHIRRTAITTIFKCFISLSLSLSCF